MDNDQRLREKTSVEDGGRLAQVDVMAVGNIRQGKVLSGSLLRVQAHHTTKGAVPYQVHVMIAMASLLLGLTVFVVKANRRATRRQLKKFVVQ